MVTMVSTTPTQPPQYASRLLQLPREIRDIIYHYVLVRNTIPIESAAVNYCKTTRRSPGFRKALSMEYPCRFTHHYRRTWTVASFDLKAEFGTYDLIDEPRTVQLTYQYSSHRYNCVPDSIDVQLLQISKQIYAEAVKILYGKNKFTFNEDGVPVAFNFLCDRPAASLLLVTSLSLGLTENNNMGGTSDAHYPVTRRATDNLTLQYVYNHFTDLCTLLSTSRIQLKNLHLTVRTYSQHYDLAPGSIEECLSWEAIKTDEARPWVPIWIDPLLKIHSVNCITMCWMSARPRIRRIADTMTLLRREMSLRKQCIKQHQQQPASQAKVDLWMLQHGYPTAEDMFVRIDTRGSSLNGKLSFGGYSLQGNELWQSQDGKDTQRSKDWLEECLSVLIPECSQKSIEGTYVCYSELRNI